MTTSPLQYHMNDLVYYLGLNTGGNIDKQISILERMASMAKGMTLRREGLDDENYKLQVAEIDEFIEMTTFLRSRYLPMMDTNQFLIPQTRRMKQAVNIVATRAFFIVNDYKLVSGNAMRARLMNIYGKDRIIRDEDGD